MKLRNRTCARKVILLYHRIARMKSDPWGLCVTPEHFAEHLEVLREYSPTRLSEIQSGQQSGDPKTWSIAVTFDDGYADNFEQAAPLFERYEIPATFFIVTAYVEGTREFWWDELEKLFFHTPSPLPPLELLVGDRVFSILVNETRSRRALFLELYELLQPLSHDARLVLMDQLLERCQQDAAVRPSHRVMTKSQIRDLAANGLFEVGAHTCTHPKLSTQSVSAQHAEISGSKVWLESLIGHSVTGFSYPYGAPHHYTQETLRIVGECGFKYACTAAGRFVEASDEQLQLPRLNVTDMDGSALEMLLSG